MTGKSDGGKGEAPAATSFKIPKYAQRILAHLGKCFVEHRCILCADCLAFALLFIEEAPRLVRGQPYIIKANGPYSWFIKFLLSTLPGKPESRRYNPCPHNRMNYDDVYNFALFLLRLTPEERRAIRSGLLCHEEFKMPLKRPTVRKIKGPGGWLYVYE